MNQKEEKIDLGGIFLKQFVKELIKASYYKKQPRKEEKSKELVKEFNKQSIEVTKNPLVKEKVITKNVLPVTERRITIVPRPIQPVQNIKTIDIGEVEKKNINTLERSLLQPKDNQVFPVVKPVEVTKNPVVQMQSQKPSSSQASSGISMGSFEKIKGIIADPAVVSIECPGPSKPILVNRSGITQTANISLNADEIQAILIDISRRTKIPLVQGVFKAAIANLIITAVISDFVGSRFMIEKKNPFQNQAPPQAPR